LVEHPGEHLACKELSDDMLSWLSGARFKIMWSKIVYLSGAGLKEAVKRVLLYSNSIFAFNALTLLVKYQKKRLAFKTLLLQ